MRKSSVSKLAASAVLIGCMTATKAQKAPIRALGSNKNDISVYWGQNSYGQSSGPLVQQPLAHYCDDPNIDVIPMAFLYQLTTGTGGQPVINLSNIQNNCSFFPGTALIDCPDIGNDIKTCQQKGKKILISIGGATYTEGGFSTADKAIAAAKMIWAVFGPPGQKVPNTNTTGSTTGNSGLYTQTSNPGAYVATSSTLAGILPTTSTVANAAYTPPVAAGVYTPPVAAAAPAPYAAAAAAPVPGTPGVYSGAYAGAGNAAAYAPSTNTGAYSPAANNGAYNPATNNGAYVPPANNGAYTATPVYKRDDVDALRPFGDAVIDGFDFDFESTTSNLIPFAKELRSLMDADTSRSYFLTAAPQCPYPDLADQEVLDSEVKFDAVWIQFYNNNCGLQSYVANATNQTTFNYAQWDTWAKTKSANKDVKLFLGVPADTTASSTGYMALEGLKPIIAYTQTFPSFGGVMMWDATQAYANKGFLDGVRAAIGGPEPAQASSSSSSATTSGGLIGQTGSVSASQKPATSGGDVDDFEQYGVAALQKAANVSPDDARRQKAIAEQQGFIEARGLHRHPKIKKQGKARGRWQVTAGGYDPSTYEEHIGYGYKSDIRHIPVRWKA